MANPIKIGIGGPVGAGKTQLIEKVVKRLSKEMSIGVITNDIYTKEDEKILVNSGVLPESRIIGVETGGCPHTAIREDASMNFAAIDELLERHDDIELIFIESGGDNLAATFSPELVDFSIYIIDGGQGMIKSDFFVINKTDLAPYVGASLEQMAEDTKVFRGKRPFTFTNLKTDEGLDEVIDWIERDTLLKGLS
ncbi:TPA: urease accessory protein UreG [Staphylococcus aureus]|nr:urease accessory protein UreG [Staphylococcus aureus]